MAAQPAISASERLQPAHSPVVASITHTLMQGVSMRLSIRRLAATLLRAGGKM